MEFVQTPAFVIVSFGYFESVVFVFARCSGSWTAEGHFLVVIGTTC